MNILHVTKYSFSNFKGNIQQELNLTFKEYTFHKVISKKPPWLQMEILFYVSYYIFYVFTLCHQSIVKTTTKH